MATLRYYYSDTISMFLTRSTDEIVGKLTLASQHDINNETSNSWVEEIESLRNILAPYKDRGSIYFEYNIPRMGRRADVILVIDELVFILEYKTAGSKFAHDARTQVWDYAIDLKNFQEGSLARIIIPVLIAPSEKDKNCTFNLRHFEDDVYEPLQTNNDRLAEAISLPLAQIPHATIPHSDERDERWAKSGYEPTPTIIEAAVALYEENTVEDITKHGGDIDKASADLLLRYTDMTVEELARRSGTGTRTNLYFIYERDLNTSPTTRSNALRKPGECGRYKFVENNK